MSDPDPAPATFTVSMSLLLDVYLDGFGTGAASAVRTIGGPQDVPDQICDQLADALVGGIEGDPIVMAAIERSIHERLNDIDSGPVNITSFAGVVNLVPKEDQT